MLCYSLLRAIACEAQQPLSFHCMFMERFFSLVCEAKTFAADNAQSTLARGFSRERMQA
jgi:hypothetical protein